MIPAAVQLPIGRSRASVGGMRDFHLPGRSQVFATNGMAATSMPASTLAALDALRAGGNALDAAVAAVAVQCVVEPQSTGIGGDCFCLYAPAGSGKVVALNGSGCAPAAATIDWYEARGITALENTSPHSVTVPGAVAAWETLLAAHGTKGLDELLRPAIRYAEEGFVVHPRLAFDWVRLEDKLLKNGAEAFLPHGRAPVAGERFVQPNLAATLRAIAKTGAPAFYEGPVAADMVAVLNARGGLHTEADFAAGRLAPEFVPPIRTSWRGFEVWQCPPNGAGLLVLMLLGILGGMPSAPDGPMGPLRLHRHAEAARLVYRDRDAFLADPAQVAVPVERLTSPEYLAELRATIRDEQAMRVLPPAGEAAMPVHADTVYLCVVDRDGNAASFINSLFQGFGSGILAEKSGIMLQNRGFGFRLERGHPNCIAPGKRPMHTIIPGMLTKGGEALMPFGVMGGHFQPMGQTLFLTNFLEYGLDIQEALDAPRVLPYHGKLEIERGVPAATVEALVRRGHDPVVVDRPLGGGQAIWIDRARGVLCGGSDPRKDGLALGY
jgi:gamma-glutamyltranspeptidase / glutathione hydrolase